MARPRLQRGRADAEIDNRLSAFLPTIELSSTPRHFAQGVEKPRAQRISPKHFENQCGVRHEKRGNEWKRRRGRIGRHDDALRRKIRPALQGDAASVWAFARTYDLRSEMLNIAPGVITRASFSTHDRLARRGKPADKTADFT